MTAAERLPERLPEPLPAPLIEYRAVAKAFAGQPVLRELSLAIGRGEIMYIIGTSGVGKSVAIKLLIGLLRIDAGEIWFDGGRVDQLPERALAPLRKRIGMVFQSSTLFDSMTLAENVALPLRAHRGLAWAAALDDARRRLAQVYMAEHAERYPAELSDGMRKRAAIARTLALDPEVVLFDEPTTGLDPVSARRIDRLIRELASSLGVTAIVVSHDPPSIFGTADRVALLYQGAVRALATPAELRASADPIVQQFITGASSGPMETPGF
ncbi:MAG TPA: ATP-binding cassette domain-containing protein [Kofleriaceae bacterium]|nr:ATP-binding cassette domain-containing protein [Kofleriaceae bacterium]